jgi:CheY-like chemotaxis protein
MLELDQVHPPLMPRNAPDRFPQPMPTPTVPHRQYGVLVVDDEETVCGVLRIGLENHGFAVHVAASGPEALKKYAQHSTAIHVALLDIHMHGMDGPQTLAALHDLNPDLRGCFMSGRTESYTREQLRGMGASGFFRKPFRMAAVAQALWELAASPAEPCQQTALA